MKIKKLRNQNDAVVGIIVTVLLIGLILIVVSIIQTVFIPNWMERIEAEHMDEVSQQFSQLKFAIDIQSSLEKPDLPVNAPITIGSKGFPILQSSQSFGKLDILHNASLIEIDNATILDFNVSISDIVFSSYNSYFLDQTYVYEAGSIILSQDEGNIMTIPPTFNIERTISDIYLDLSLINLTILGNKDSISGFGTYPIRVEYNDALSDTSFQNLDYVTYINITTSYPEAWALYFKTILDSIDIPDPETLITPLDNQVIIDFTSSGFNVFVDYKVIVIDSQIAPGWVE